VAGPENPPRRTGSRRDDLHDRRLWRLSRRMPDPDPVGRP